MQSKQLVNSGGNFPTPRLGITKLLCTKSTRQKGEWLKGVEERGVILGNATAATACPVDPPIGDDHPKGVEAEGFGGMGAPPGLDPCRSKSQDLAGRSPLPSSDAVAWEGREEINKTRGIKRED